MGESGEGSWSEEEGARDERRRVCERLSLLLVQQRRHERVRLLLAPVHAEGDADREPADDLLVRRVVRVPEHLLNRLRHMDHV